MIISETNSTKEEKTSDISTSKVDDDTFTFEFVGDKLEGKKEFAEYLMKWYDIPIEFLEFDRGLKDNLKAHTFRHNFKFNDLHPETFFLDLFNNPDVRNLVSNVFLNF